MNLLTSDITRRWLFLLFASVIVSQVVGITTMLLVLFSFLLYEVIEKKNKVLFGYIIVFKLCVALAVTVIADHVFRDGLLPGQPDQYFYMTTAREIAKQIGVHGLAVNYASVVGVHNSLYNVALGWVTYFGAGNVLDYRLFGVFGALALTLYIGKLSDYLMYGDKRATQFAIVAVSLLPTVNLFTGMVMRDIYICLTVAVFFYMMVKNNFFGILLVISVCYYLRMQLSIILVIIAMLWCLLAAGQYVRKFTLLKNTLFVTVVCLSIFIIGIGSTFAFPKLAYVRHFLSGQFIFGFLLTFPIGFSGLDFLWAPSSEMTMTRMHLLIGHLVTPETLILPTIFIVSSLLYRRLWNVVQRRLALCIWLFIIIYSFGYYIQYRVIFTRLLLPVYPLLLVACLPFVFRITKIMAACPGKE